MPLEKPDAHRIALHAEKHLTAFEEINGPETSLVQELRSHFKDELKELHRQEFHPRLDRLIPQERKEHRPAQVETPLITENVGLNQLVFLLLERVTNLKGLLYQFYKQSDKHDTENDFGIRIEPFINKVSQQEIQAVLTDLMPRELDPTNDGAFMDYVEQIVAAINAKKLTGTSHSFLSKHIRKRRNTAEYRNAARNYIRTLSQRYERLAAQQNPQAAVSLQNIRDAIISLLCISHINELSYQGIDRLDYSDVLTAYADELALALDMRVDPVARDERLDFEYAPRTRDFLDVGTRYGDCTSRDKIKQVDQVPNVFWSIASYMTDIFHQVQELRINGEPLMKVHLAPCFFRGEPALNVDAIETSLRIRDFKSNRDPIPNPSCDPELFARRKEFYDLTFERIRHLADMMGIETIICDGYSNTQWVRQELEQFPSTVYHMNEYRSLYEGDFPRDFAEAILGIRISTRTEVQALNTMIWDQGLRPYYKENRTVRGEVYNSPGSIRGI